MRVSVRQETELALALQHIGYLEDYLVQGKNSRLYARPVRNVCQGKGLSFGMRVLAVGRGVRVYNHHAVDVVDVREMHDTRLVYHKQCQQE